MHRERSCLRARRKRRRSVAPSAADRFGTLPPTLNPLSLDDSEYQSHILSHTLSLLRNIISLFVVTFGGHVQDPLPPGSGLIVRQMNADPWLVAEFLRGPGAAISYLLIGRFCCPSVYRTYVMRAVCKAAVRSASAYSVRQTPCYLPPRRTEDAFVFCRRT
jgi:hypothetical protein